MAKGETYSSGNDTAHALDWILTSACVAHLWAYISHFYDHSWSGLFFWCHPCTVSRRLVSCTGWQLPRYLIETERNASQPTSTFTGKR